MTHTIEINGSSTIKKISYNDWYHDMIVTFVNSSSYIYREVTAEVYNGLIDTIRNSGSVGSYFYKNIRTSFEYQKI